MSKPQIREYKLRTIAFLLNIVRPLHLASLEFLGGWFRCYHAKYDDWAHFYKRHCRISLRSAKSHPYFNAGIVGDFCHESQKRFAKLIGNHSKI